MTWTLLFGCFHPHICSADWRTIKCSPSSAQTHEDNECISIRMNCTWWTAFLVWRCLFLQSSPGRTKSCDGSLSVSPLYSATFIIHSSTHGSCTRTHTDMHACCSADINLSAGSFKRTRPGAQHVDRQIDTLLLALSLHLSLLLRRIPLFLGEFGLFRSKCRHFKTTETRKN